jgi:hypothetical protein
MVWIAGQTVGSGGTSSLIFDNVPQTFAHLQVRLSVRTTASANSDLVYFWNAPSGITTAQWHILTGDGSTASSGNGTAAVYAGTFPAATSTANTFGSTIVDILDYSSSNKLKTFRCLGGFDLNGSGVAQLWSGLWSGANTAISSIRLNCGTGAFAQYTRVDIYGITTSQVTGA